MKYVGPPSSGGVLHSIISWSIHRCYGMPSLDDLVQDLYHGTKEVDVLKSEVTEPLDGWEVSKYNIPHKGSKGAMRKGRLHAHDMGDHFSVHLDMVDPDKSPFGHLKVDSPFLLFVYSGFATVGVMMQQSLAEETLITRVSRWALVARSVSGLFLVLIGLIIVLYPNFLALSTVILLSIAAIGFGAFTLVEGTLRRHDRFDPIKVVLGIVLIMVGALGLKYIFLFALALVLFLAFWNLSTGIFMLKHRKDGSSPFIGLVSLLVGAVSLVIGTTLLLAPRLALELIFSMVGMLVMLFGATRVVSGVTSFKTPRASDV